ncbi:MAG TPA: polysaccharide biosynthesis/export family protein [Verrucomicrobiae bacterium]|jgi:polysaccharide export outer membrane protein
MKPPSPITRALIFARILASLAALPAAAGEYAIRPNDLVQLSVYSEDDLNVAARVADDGKIRIPLLGPITVAGKTVERASEEIRAAFAKDFLVNPRITFVVVEYSKRLFTVLGQVQRPGAYEIPVGGGLTLLEAIGLAGGLTRIGSSAKITVQRVVDGKPVTLKLDGDAMADRKSGSLSIQPSDVINIGEKWI